MAGMTKHYAEFGLPNSSEDTQYTAACRGCGWRASEEVIDGNYPDARNRIAILCFMHLIHTTAGIS